jgi:two-component system, sensor histidine kinase and response regulator
MDKQTILIVDDSPENLNVLKGLLSEDYNLKAAPNGKIALKIVNIVPHLDLILLDIMMPGMDGYEVCQRLKEDKKTEHIPIVFLTAMSEEKDEAKGLELGAIDFITKPFNPDLVKARVQNHLKLKKTIDDLNEAEKVRDALSHMIVHDLRNPLMAIQGVVGLLQMASDSLPDNIVQTHQQIQGAAEEMGDLISSILDISKMESDTMIVSSTLFNASDLAKEVAEDTKVIYDVAGVVLELKIKDDNLSIMVDEELLRRVIKNLLSNSLKFTPEGAAVVLSLEKIENNVVFRVNDKGPGIPLEFRDKIFNKFYQISSREVKKQSGVGLGLAFCRMAVEAMKGEIWVEDRPDSEPGSSFCIKLPITE